MIDKIDSQSKPDPNKAKEIEPGTPDNFSPEEEVEATPPATEEVASNEKYGTQHIDGLKDDESEQ